MEGTLWDGISEFEESGGMRTCGEGWLAYEVASWEPLLWCSSIKQGVGVVGFPILSAVQRRPSRGTSWMKVFHRAEGRVIGIVCTDASASPHTTSATYAQRGDEEVNIYSLG